MDNLINQNSTKTILISSDTLLQNLNRLQDYEDIETSEINTEIEKAISNKHELDTLNPSCVKLESAEASLISDINFEKDIKMLEVKSEAENISVIADSNAEKSLSTPQITINQENSTLPTELNENNLLATRVKIEYDELIIEDVEDILPEDILPEVKIEKDEKQLVFDLEEEISKTEIELDKEEMSLVDSNNKYLPIRPDIKTEHGENSNYSATDTLSELKNEAELKLMATDKYDDTSSSECDEENMPQKSSKAGQLRKSSLPGTSSFLKECASYLDETSVDYLKCLFSLEQHSKRNCSLSYSKLCLSLYYNSPSAYVFLENCFDLMGLTQMTTLRLPITSHCNKFVLELIKTKTPVMTAQQNMFVVYIQTIPLCENIFYDAKNDRIIGFQDINTDLKPIVGKNAVIAMIHGLHTTAKYIISNVVVGSTNNNQALKSWIEDLIKNLLDIGLDIKALISDFTPLSKDIAESLGINEKMTKFVVNGKSIHYIFNVSSLLMDARDQFMMSDFYFDNGKTARWDHIKQFHKKNMSDKANDSYDIILNPSAEQRMVSQNAIAIFNAILATALRSSIVDASDTSDLLEQFGRMFEMLNFAKFKEGCIYLCGDVYQKDVLFTEIAMFLDSLIIVSKCGGKLLFEDMEEAKEFTFINGFKVTVESVKNLLADLESEGCDTIDMWSVNQGYSEKFLKDMHQGKDLVTARDLINFLEETNLQYIIKNSNDQFGYDLSESLSRISTFMQNGSLSENLPNHVFVLRNISGTDYRVDLPPLGALSYVALQVFQVCLRIHSNCKKLRGYMSEVGSANKHGNFISLISEIDKMFVRFFTAKYLPRNIGVRLLKAIDTLNLDLPCECFPYLYMKALFIRIRLDQINNVILKREGQSNQVCLKLKHLQN